MRSLLVGVILVVGFCPFMILSYPAIPFWLAELVLKDQLLSLWGSPCILFIAFFLLLLLFILCVQFLLVWFIYMLVFLLLFILYGTLLVAWTWVAISIHILRKFSAIISSNIFSCQFLLSSSSVMLMIQMLGPLTLTQKSLRLFTFKKKKICLLYSTLLHLFPYSTFLLTYLFFWLSYSSAGSFQSVFDLLLFCSLLTDYSLFLLDLY